MYLDEDGTFKSKCNMEMIEVGFNRKRSRY